MNTNLLSSTALSLVLLTGCSTIITGARKDVNFRSDPAGAQIAIVDDKGITLYEGTTPTVVPLKTGKAYFAPKKYTVTFSKEGYETITTTVSSTMSGWYAGNLVFGGLIGLLVVDPLTGAVYTLPKEKAVTLTPNRPVGTTTDQASSVQFLTYEEIPEGLRSQLVRIN